MPPLFGEAGRLSQGPALPAHLLRVLPAEAGGGARAAALPRVWRPCAGQEGAGAPGKPPAGAAPTGAADSQKLAKGPPSAILSQRQ